MRVLVIVKATKNSEAGIMPSEKLLTDMGKFNEELVKAGIMQAGEGLKPSIAGKRIQFTGGNVSVIDGPFAETKELVAGYWIWNVKSMDEAVEWARRCPNPMPGEQGVLELRPTYALDELESLVPPEEFAREVRLRKEVKRQVKGKSKAKTKSKAKAKPAKRKPVRAKSKK